MKPDPSVRSIQIRFFGLLLRAFLVVVVLVFLVVNAATAIFMAFPVHTPFVQNRFPMITRLETYYRVTGTWQGVADALPGMNSHIEADLWRRLVLMDTDGIVIIDRGFTDTDLVGKDYQPPFGSLTVPIWVDGENVGSIAFDPSMIPTQGRIALSLSKPVVGISIFPALLTILIGLLLMRRVVRPLAEVIAAANSMSKGDLSTRVAVSGPDDLQLLLEGFNQMAESLERNDRERREMLADIAHELRTPLTVMRGRLEGIVDGVYPPEAEQILPALEETYLLERLVEDLRLLTLAETRQLLFEKQEIDLNRLASHVVDLFQAEADEKGIRLSLLAAEGGARVRLDPQRTEQVIGNLVGNSLRYIPADGRIWIEVSNDGDRVSLSVNDNGPGLPEEDLPYLFKRFWRAEKSRSRASGGAGLGLAISRQLVEAQGGKISASNLEGGGLGVRCEFFV
ncbi:MAG: HAMP domain-containing protein [Anaerolineales bacterium]|nr:HAMP domain-containing protein [Anaerolineales bacterium]